MTREPPSLQMKILKTIIGKAILTESKNFQNIKGSLLLLSLCDR